MKYKLGDYIELIDIRNRGKFNADSVLGISTNKEFIPTKANLDGVNLNSYKCVPPNSFTFVADTSRRGDKISLAYNSNEHTILVSSISTVFCVKENKGLLPEYLFMFFNRPEFDRYTRFNSWGSARETFTWDDMCDIEIELPPFAIQKRYVAVYKSMLKNQEVYEQGLEDLKLACDLTIEKLRRQIPSEKIKKYIKQINEKNNGDIKLVQGINIKKEFINPQRLSTNLNGTRVVRKGQFAYCDVMHKPNSKMPIALRKDEDCAVSGTYKTFQIIQPEKLLSEYLMMWFERPEFDRYAAYNSFGSARPTFDFYEMGQVKIPIPDIKVQKSIVDIYNAYITRMEINEKLKEQIKDICPVLIKGSLEEVDKSEKV